MMSRKICSYKGCKSMQTPDKPCPETFFQFPKDEARYELWMTLSRCQDTNPKSIKYLCSKHFDHTKYISSNPRRKLLLTNAIPYAYQSDNEEDEQLQDVVSTQFEEEEYFEIGREFVTKADREEQYDENIESTGNIDIEYIANSTPRNLKETAEIINKSVINKVERKRKIQDEICESDSDCKIVKIRVLSNQSTNQLDIEKSSNKIKQLSSKLGYSEDTLITTPHITTFIFKNDEYVQMPKKHYLEEKLELLNEIQYFKNIVMNLKNVIDNVRL